MTTKTIHVQFIDFNFQPDLYNHVAFLTISNQENSISKTHIPSLFIVYYEKCHTFGQIFNIHIFIFLHSYAYSVDRIIKDENFQE